MVEIKHLSKKFQTAQGGIKAIDDVSFEVERGDFFTLLGPSGCGKTTSLRCIAGLEKPETGEIYIDDELVVCMEKGVFVPPYKRSLGMVFQSYAIWPHMDVFNNVAFPLSQGENRLPKRKVKEKVEEALHMVRLDGLGSRPASNLSGGQQQRLAFARALAREPKVLLLDEPLSNLDSKLREEMRIELRSLVRRLNITTIYVTHDQLEALAMSKEIAVMSQGKIVQLDRPENIYKAPKNKFVASFIGSTNLFEGTAKDKRTSNTEDEVETVLGVLKCFLSKSVKKGDKVLLSCRPEDILVYHQKPSSSENILEGVVTAVVFLGDSIDCRVSVAGESLRIKLNSSVAIAEGEAIFLQLPAQVCTVIPLT